ncbi:MAG: retropepsin-like aspartic protease [Odoribacter sp.]
MNIRQIIGIIGLIAWCIGSEGVCAQFCARIPFRYEGGKLLVNAKVNGEPGNFIFDTGAPVCITHSYATRLGIKGGKEVRFQDSNGQINTSKVLTLNSLQLGDVDFKQVECAIFNKGDQIENFGVDGIIGYTLLMDKIIGLDGKAKEIILSDNPDYFSLNPAWACEMVGHSYLPMVEIKMGETIADTVMFDSGAGGFYDLSEKSFERLRNTDRLQIISKGHGILSLGAGGLENTCIKYRVKIPLFTLCSGLFNNVTSLTTSGGSRIGAGLLEYGKVTIDYRRHRFYFEPYSEEAPNLYQKEWNVIITVMNDQLTAGFIWESMEGQLEGGEKIVEVNGQRFDKVNAYQAMTTHLVNLSGEEGEIVVIDRKTGEERRLRISRE